METGAQGGGSRAAKGRTPMNGFQERAWRQAAENPWQHIAEYCQGAADRWLERATGPERDARDVAYCLARFEDCQEQADRAAEAARRWDA